MITKALILFVLLVPFRAVSQEVYPASQRKAWCEIEIGGAFKTILGNNTMEPASYLNKASESFFTKPTFGYSSGMIFNYGINSRWSISTGLLFFLRRTVLECNQDTVAKYGNGSTMRDIHNVFKYNYACNNLEIPLTLNFKRSRIDLHAGFNLALITKRKATYSYLINQYPYKQKWVTSDKSISGYEMPLEFYPTLRISYKTTVNRFVFYPFISLYSSMKNHMDYYIQMGFRFPIVNESK